LTGPAVPCPPCDCKERYASAPPLNFSGHEPHCAMRKWGLTEPGFWREDL